jgi:GH35 family endo-1,4-beta-xylanase
MLLFFLIFYLTNYTIIHAQNPVGLKAYASPRGLILGTAVGILYLRGNVDDGRYSDYLNQNYQMIVPGSEFMSAHIWVGENQYYFNDTDWLLGATPNSTGWAQQMGYKIRGHNLIWAYESKIPTWLLERESSITPEKAKSLLSDFIHTVVGRYRGKVLWWDVINEAISDRNEARPFNLRDSFWYRKLGTDFILYAFRFANEADPDVKLFYNEYNIEHGGLKANRTLAFISWLQSQGIPIYGLGMQWHINTSEVITPGDDHYQIAQQFLDLNISLTISELDVAIQMKGGYPVDPDAIQKQAIIYRSLLQYVLHFFPKIPAMISWGYTDRYSWIPLAKNYTQGDGLPLDCQYQPKAAFWQLQEELAHVLANGIYRLSPQSQTDKCLGTDGNGTITSVQLYSGNCNNTNQKWNVTWQGDGTYRFSPQIARNSALTTYNAMAPVGDVATSNWTGDFNQEWVIISQGNNTYRIGPRNAWWRVLAVDKTSNIVIISYTNDDSEQWIFHNV